MDEQRHLLAHSLVIMINNASKQVSDPSQQHTFLGQLFPEVFVGAAEAIPKDGCSIISVEFAMMKVMPSGAPTKGQNLKWRERQLVPTVRIHSFNPPEAVVIKER